MQKISQPPTVFQITSSQKESERFNSRLMLAGVIVSSIIIAIASSFILVNVSPVLALASILAIPAFILFFFKPEIGLMTLILILPLEELNVDGGFSAIKMISIVVFGCAILNYIIYRPHEPLVRSSQNGLILLFILVALVSVFVAIDPSRVLERMGKLLRVVALYFFTLNLIRSEKYLRLGLWLFVIGGLLSTLYGFFDPAQVGQRFEGALGQPNGYALTMTPRIPIALALIMIEKKLWKKILLAIMIGFISYGIILSGSRGGLLAVSLALILFTLFQKNKFVWIALVSLLFIVGLSIMPDNIKMRVGLMEATSGVEVDNSTDRRLTYQVYGVDLFRQNPILGIGLDGFAEAYARSEYRFLVRTRDLRVAHNTYLEIATGTGIVGFIPFIAILLSGLVLAWKYSQKKYWRISPELVIVAIGLFSALGGYYLGMAFGSRQYEKTFWFLLALPVILKVLMDRRASNQAESGQSIQSE
jgi:O-antigen ligase